MMEQDVVTSLFSADVILLQEIFQDEAGRFKLLKELPGTVNQLQYLKHAVTIFKPLLKPDVTKTFPLGGDLFIHVYGDLVYISSSSTSNNIFHGVGSYLVIQPIAYGVQMLLEQLFMMLEWSYIHFNLALSKMLRSSHVTSATHT